MVMLVYVVADYGPAGDLAFAEVAQRLVAALPGAAILTTPVGPFDTLAAGFVVAQLALNDGPAERIVFHNVAPRQDEPDPRRANEGERFTLGEAPNGTLVVGASMPKCIHAGGRRAPRETKREREAARVVELRRSAARVVLEGTAEATVGTERSTLGTGGMVLYRRSSRRRWRRGRGERLLPGRRRVRRRRAPPRQEGKRVAGVSLVTPEGGRAASVRWFRRVSAHAHAAA